jgi:hypothetical protein
MSALINGTLGLKISMSGKSGILFVPDTLIGG